MNWWHFFIVVVRIANIELLPHLTLLGQFDLYVMIIAASITKVHLLVSTVYSC
jgi:hypothetical protein